MTTKDINTLDMDFHKTLNKWVLWAHLPHDTDWSINSYKPIYKFTSVEETIAITETLPEVLLTNCMLFVMKEGIQPMWEDPRNKDGGCFSYKVINKNVVECWKNLTYLLVGETLSSSNAVMDAITGITISPKKNFCIVKIWLTNQDYQNPKAIKPIAGLQADGCIFKIHDS